MALYYTLIIKETEPANPQPGWIWVKASLSQTYIFIGTQWIPFVGAGSIASFVEGFYWQDISVQETSPSEEVGKIWIKPSINQAYIFLDGWTVFLGA